MLWTQKLRIWNLLRIVPKSRLCVSNFFCLPPFGGKEKLHSIPMDGDARTAPFIPSFTTMAGREHRPYPRWNRKRKRRSFRDVLHTSNRLFAARYLFKKKNEQHYELDMSLLTTSKRNVPFEGPITPTKDFKPSCFDATLHPTASHFFPSVASCCDAERTWISGHPRLLSGGGYKHGTTVDFGGKSIKSQETMIQEASLEIKHLCDYKLNEESFGAVVCWWLKD